MDLTLPPPHPLDVCGPGQILVELTGSEDNPASDLSGDAGAVGRVLVLGKPGRAVATEGPREGHVCSWGGGLKPRPPPLLNHTHPLLIHVGCNY